MSAERMLEECRTQLACWMIVNGFATGHGDTIAELLKELEWQVKELRGTMYEDELPAADMGDQEYDTWFARSRVVAGVRMGPRVESNG